MLEEDELLKQYDFQILREPENVSSSFIKPLKKIHEVIKSYKCCDGDYDTYFFCSCRDKNDETVICRNCSETCHKTHEEKSPIVGRYVCSCGDRNHIITPEDEKMKINNIKQKNECFFELLRPFMVSIKPKKMEDGKKYCDICIQLQCHDKITNLRSKNNLELNENEINFNENKCECNSHKLLNPLSFICQIENIPKKAIFHNLNPNILFVSEKLKQQFNQYLGRHIKNIFEENDPSIKQSLKKKFAENYLIIEYFILFFTKLNRNSYSHWNNFFKDYSKEDRKLSSRLLEFISTNDINSKNVFKNYKESMLNEYFNFNFHFFKLFFEVLIKSHFKENNNLLKSKSVINLNIFQRYIYLHQADVFFSFEKLLHVNKKEDLLENFDGLKKVYDFFLIEFINNLIQELEIFSLKISKIEKEKNDENFFNVSNWILVSYLKIFQFFFKYNLMKRDIKKSFFKIISEISYKYSLYLKRSTEEKFNDYFIKINNSTGKFSDKSFNEMKELITSEEKFDFQQNLITFSNILKNFTFTFHIMKCIYHFMLCENDHAFIDNLKILKQGKKVFQDFAFSSNSLQSVWTAFIYTLYIYYESVYCGLKDKYFQTYKKKFLKMDFYIKNILECFIGNNNSYLKTFDAFLDNFNKTLNSVMMKNDFESKKESEIKNFIISKLGKLYNNNPNKKTDFSDEKLEFLLSIDSKNYNNLIMNINNKHKTNINFFGNFIALKQKFGDLNKKYYLYKIDYFKYIEEINNLFIKLIEFIQTLNNSNNFKENHDTNYIEKRKFENTFNLELQHLKEQNITQDDCDISINNIFKSLQNSEKYKIFKIFLEFTDFFYKLTEFIDIYSKRHYFKEAIGNNLLTIKNGKFILKFLSEYAYNNINGLPLIFNLRPKNLVNSFLEENENLCLLLKSVCKTIIKNDYFANYIWLFKFIKCLLRTIDTQSGKLNKNDIIVITNILKYFNPILTKANNDNPEIIDILELILEYFKIIKSNKGIFKDLIYYLFSELRKDNLNNLSKRNFEKQVNENSKINIISDRDNLKVEISEMNESSIMINDISNNFVETAEVKFLGTTNEEEPIKTNFLISYYKILNTIYEKKLNYFNIFTSKNHALFNFNLTIEKLFYIKNLNLKLRIEVEKYLHNFNLSSSYKLEKISEKFSSYCFENFSNKSSKRPLHNDLGYESIIKKLNFSFILLKKQIKSFMIKTNLEQYIQHIKIENKDKSNHKSLSEIVNIFYYFEECIFNPLYKLLHLSQMEKKSLDGEAYFKIYEIIYNFMDLLKIIYNKVPDNLYLLINDENNNAKNRKAYDHITLKFTLSKAEKYFLDINYEKIGYLKHFQFAALLDLFRAIVLNIRRTNVLKNVYLKNKIYKHRNFEKEIMKCYETPTHQKVLSEKFLDIFNDLESKYLSENQKGVIKIVKDYREKMVNFLMEDFAFFKNSKDKSEFNWEYECVLKYLFTKFFENLTHLNYKDKILGYKFQMDIERPIKNKEESVCELSLKNEKEIAKSENRSQKNREETKNVDEINIKNIHRNNLKNDINKETIDNNANRADAAYLHLQDKDKNLINIDDNDMTMKIPYEKILDNMDNDDEESYIFIEDSKMIEFDNDSEIISIENEENKKESKNNILIDNKKKETNDNDDDYNTIKFINKQDTSKKLSKEIDMNDDLNEDGKEEIDEEIKKEDENEKKIKLSENTEEETEQEEFRFEDYFWYSYIDYKNIKIQNFHYLKIITYLFSYHPVLIQDSFEEILQVKDINFEVDKWKDPEVLYKKINFLKHTRFNNFTNFIIKYFIFGFLNLEILKVSEISINNNSNFYDFIYDNLMTAIYFYQSLVVGSKKMTPELVFPFNIIFESQIIQGESKSNNINTSLSKIFEKNNQNNITLKENFEKVKTTIYVQFTSLFLQILIDIVNTMHFDYDKEIKFSFLYFRNDINLINFHSRISRVLSELNKGCYNTRHRHYFENISFEEVPKILLDSSGRSLQKIPLTRLLIKTVNFLKENNHLNNEQDLLLMMHNNFIFLKYLFDYYKLNQRYIEIIFFCLDEKSLIQIIIKSIIKLTLRFNYQISYENPMFNYYLKNLDLGKINLSNLINQYIYNSEYCKDQNFIIASLIFYLLLLSAKQYQIEFAEKFFEQVEFLKSKAFKETTMEEVYNTMTSRKKNSIEELNKLNVFKDDNKKLFLLNGNYENFKKLFYIDYLINYKYLNGFGSNSSFNFNMETNNFNNLYLEESGYHELKSTNKLLCHSSDDYQNKINYGITYHEVRNFVKFLEFSGLNLSSLTNYNMIKENFINRKILIEKNGLLLSINFFKKIFKSVEFVSSYQYKVFFTIKPLFMQINKSNRNKLFFDFDRKNPERKIDSLYKAIDFFNMELNYKKENLNKGTFWNNLQKKLFDIDYKYVDLASFTISLVIQIYLFTALDIDNMDPENDKSVQNIREYYVVASLGICQLVLNFCFFCFYVLSKYNFSYIISFNNLWKDRYSHLEKNEINKEQIKENLSYYDRIKLGVFDSLLFNQEIFFVIFNLIIGFSAIWNFRYFFAYTLQLFTVIRYIKSIQDFFRALKNRGFQLLATVIFLFMVTTFFANIGMYFMKDESDGRPIGHVKNFFF